MTEAIKMSVTPKMAADWIASSPGNPRWKGSRKLFDEAKVSTIVRDIKNGKWAGPGTHAIGIRVDGTLCEGHHRCEAIRRAGVPVECLVVFGITPEEELHLDENDKRTVAQRLGTNNTVPSVARIHLAILRKQPISKLKLTASEAESFIREHPLVDTAYQISCFGSTSPIARKAGIIHGLLCALEYGVDEMTLRKMVKVVNTGFSDGKGESSAIVLRNSILKKNWANGQSLQLSAMTQAAIYDFVCKAPRTKPYTMRSGKYFEYMVAQGRSGYVITA